jgi:hypothetical protein
LILESCHDSFRSFLLPDCLQMHSRRMF